MRTPWISAPRSAAIKGAQIRAISECRFIENYSVIVYDAPRVFPKREGSIQTDISSDLGDLRIQTNYDGKCCGFG